MNQIKGVQILGYQESNQGNSTFHSYNPETETSNVAVFANATKEETNQAADLAEKAYLTYSNLSGEQRSQFLYKICDKIDELGDTLIQTYCSETGLPEGRAQGEKGRTINQIKQFAEIIKTDKWRNVTITKAIPDRQPVPRSEIKKMLIPMGPIVVFGASNFPLAFSVAGGDTASALAVGCPVIVKGHPLHAGTGELVARCIKEAAKETSMPEGTFSYLISDDYKLGQWLVSAPPVKAVGFTGSIKGGRALYDIANNRPDPIPVFAEMGSINPVVVTQKALDTKFNELVAQLSGSVCLGAGQFCTNPGLIVTVGKKAQEFADELNTMVQQSSKTMLHPQIKSRFKKDIDVFQPNIKHFDQVDAEGESKVTGAVGYVGASHFLSSEKYSEEVFGPYSLVVGCEDEMEAAQVIKACPGQLTGTLMTSTADQAAHLLPLINVLQQKVGRLIFNGVPTGVEVCEAMVHGGPYPASSDSRYTAVGADAIYRWLRPIAYQDFPDELLPEVLKA